MQSRIAVMMISPAEGGGEDRVLALADALTYPYEPGPFGREDPSSDCLYREMIASESANTMIAIIDAAATRVEPDLYPGNEADEIRVDRLLALLQDMPEAVPEDERMRAWGHFLDADWVHAVSHEGVVDSVVASTLREKPAFGERLVGLVGELLATKVTDFDAQTVGVYYVPGRPEGTINMRIAMDTLGEVRKGHPGLRHLYNSITLLAMTLSRATR